MKFLAQSIPGVFIIEPEPFVDERGMFRRHFAKEEFSAHGIVDQVVHANVSENKFKHTLRGFHYQLSPHGEGKTLSCLRGSIYDIVVDLRPASPTYMKWVAVELDDQNRRSVHIPPGCANAFLTLVDDCLIHYYCSEAYHGASERGVRYNDPLFNFSWPAEPEVISDKDKNHPDFQPESSISL